MDPYRVLGVSRDADEETIKKAYRELVKKYHPDKYVNTPMAEVANEKMKEVNEAYDMIMKGGASQQSAGAGASGGYNTYDPFGGYGHAGGAGQSYTQPSFQAVRALINMGRVIDAERMLNRLPRTAEWYFLNGLLNMRRGWYDRAVESIQTAVNMDPNNVEYRRTLENIENVNTTYTSSPYNTGGVRCGGCACPCDLCTMCICLNCCTGGC